MRANISSNVKNTVKLRDTETVMRSLGEGCWKSTKIGNSLAAYPAASTVLESSEGGDSFTDFSGVKVLRDLHANITTMKNTYFASMITS